MLREWAAVRSGWVAALWPETGKWGVVMRHVQEEVVKTGREVVVGNSDSCFRSGIVVGDETNQGRAKIESSWGHRREAKVWGKINIDIGVPADLGLEARLPCLQWCLAPRPEHSRCSVNTCSVARRKDRYQHVLSSFLPVWWFLSW